MDLSVIISNRNDTIMLTLTIVSLMEAFKAYDGKTEIVICDNSDKQLRPAIRQAIPPGLLKRNKVRIIEQDFPCLFTARETAIQEAKADVVLCIDSHMLIGHNLIKDCMAFMSDPPPKLAFAHPPCAWAENGGAGRHYRDLRLDSQNNGKWFTVRDEPRKMTWKGMPWLIYKDRFFEMGGYGAFSKNKISWGGGDFYLAIKPWLLGFENWAVPTGPGIHLGPFTKIRRKEKEAKHGLSMNYRYRLYGPSGITPYGIGAFVGYYILGGEELMKVDPCGCNERYRVKIEKPSKWAQAIMLGRKDKEWLDARKKWTYNEFVTAQPWEDDEGTTGS